MILYDELCRKQVIVIQNNTMTNALLFTKLLLALDKQMWKIRFYELNS